MRPFDPGGCGCGIDRAPIRCPFLPPPNPSCGFAVSPRPWLAAIVGGALSAWPACRPAGCRARSSPSRPRRLPGGRCIVPDAARPRRLSCCSASRSARAVTPETVATMVDLAAQHAGAHDRDGRRHHLGDGLPEIRARLGHALGAVRRRARRARARRWRSRRTPARTCAPIAMVQTVRLFILAVALPVAFAAFGVAGLPPPRGADAPLLRII